jgi:hypothetical protein
VKLVNFDQSKLLPQERFHANGFELLKLGKYRNTTNNMVEILRNLLENRQNNVLPEKFSWEQKMPNVFHLRPNVYEYNDVFLNFLFDNDIDVALENLTGKRLHLCHAQAVIQTPGPPHQDWHRDSYQYGSDPIVGAFPAVVKVNFYPQFGSPEPRLKFIRGSHRCAANDPRFDSMLISKYENEVLESSNEQALIFESSMLHGVIPDVEPQGSIRVMYSFSMEHEYIKRFADKEGHRKLHDQYEARVTRRANDKFEIVENYLRQQINQGYGGNPYCNDLEAELKYDGALSAYEDIADHIEWIKKKEKQDNDQ